MNSDLRAGEGRGVSSSLMTSSSCRPRGQPGPLTIAFFGDFLARDYSLNLIQHSVGHGHFLADHAVVLVVRVAAYLNLPYL